METEETNTTETREIHYRDFQIENGGGVMRSGGQITEGNF